MTIHQIETEGYTLVVQQVSLAASQMGYRAGKRLAESWRTCMTHNAFGKVMLSFDGYDNDPRPLCEVPQVVDFCKGLVGSGSQAMFVLSLLVDERVMKVPTGHAWWDMPGRLWLVAHTMPGAPVWCKDLHGSGLLRDMDANEQLLEQLLMDA